MVSKKRVIFVRYVFCGIFAGITSNEKEPVTALIEYRWFIIGLNSYWNSLLDYSIGLLYWITLLEFSIGILYWNSLLEFSIGILFFWSEDHSSGILFFFREEFRFYFRFTHCTILNII
jgi:hypothetical protein